MRCGNGVAIEETSRNLKSISPTHIECCSISCGGNGVVDKLGVGNLSCIAVCEVNYSGLTTAVALKGTSVNSKNICVVCSIIAKAKHHSTVVIKELRISNGRITACETKKSLRHGMLTVLNCAAVHYDICAYSTHDCNVLDALKCKVLEGYGCAAHKVEHCIRAVSCKAVRLSKLVSVTVNSNRLVDVGCCAKLCIARKNDCRSVLCSLDSRFKTCIISIADLCNYLYSRVNTVSVSYHVTLKGSSYVKSLRTGDCITCACNYKCAANITLTHDCKLAGCINTLAISEGNAVTVKIEISLDLKIIVKLKISKKLQAIGESGCSTCYLSLSVQICVIDRCEVGFTCCVYSTGYVNGCNRSELEGLVTKIKHGSVLNSKAESAGYAAAVRSVYCYRITESCELTLYGKSRAVNGKSRKALGCIDNFNILKYNVLCTVDINTCCVVVTIKSYVLKSNVIGVYADKVSLVVLNIETAGYGVPGSSFISLNAVTLTVDSNCLSNNKLTGKKNVIKKNYLVASLCSCICLCKGLVVCVADLGNNLDGVIYTILIFDRITCIGRDSEICALGSKCRCCVNVEITFGHILNRSRAAVDNLDLTCVVTVKCVTGRATAGDGEGRAINNDRAIVTAVLTELNSLAGKNRAVYKSKSTAVTEIIAESNSRVVNYNVAVRSSDTKLSTGCKYRILNIDIESRILIAGRCGKSELVSKLCDRIFEADVKGLVCRVVLTGGIAKGNVRILYREAYAVTGNGYTAGNYEGRNYVRLVGSLSICKVALDYKLTTVTNYDSTCAGELKRCAGADSSSGAGIFNAVKTHLSNTCEGDVAVCGKSTANCKSVTIEDNISGNGDVTVNVSEKNDFVACLCRCKSVLKSIEYVVANLYNGS